MDPKRLKEAFQRLEALDERLKEAVRRVQPDQIDFFLHPQFSAASKAGHKVLATGLNVSPGAATGVVAFDPDLAERWAKARTGCRQTNSATAVASTSAVPSRAAIIKSFFITLSPFLMRPDRNLPAGRS